MAKSFNLTAELNLRGPANLKVVVANIKKQLATVNGNIKLQIDPSGSKNIAAITRSIGAMNKALVLAKQNTASLDRALKDLSASLGSIGSAGASSAAGINNTSKAATAVTNSVGQATSKMEEFGKQSYLAIKRFAAFSIVSGGIYSLINAITSGTKAFIEFDSQIVKLQQVTGKSKAGLADLTNEITRLSTTLGVSSASLIDVASTLAQAGFNANDTRIALEALALTELAPSFDNITDTVEGSIAAIRQFGLQASDLKAALGSINAVAAAFAVESADIIAAIQRTGGVFAAASKGVSEGKDALNEFLAVFTSVRATTRESAETIATGLRTIFTRIQRGKTIDQLREFGIELTDVEGKFVGPYEAVKRLSEGLKTLDPRDIRFSSIVEELGGFRQIGKVIPLIQQFATAQEALKIAQRGQDSLIGAQITAQQSLAVQLAKVREQFLALIRDVGQSTAFQNLFKIVTSLASGLISLVGAFKPILPLLGLLGAIKGIGAITKFGSGFIGELNKGSATGAGKNIGSSIAGTKEKEKADTNAKVVDALRSNTDALKNLTSSVNSLNNTINSKGGATGLNDGGSVRKFARGGVVPGSGNRDTVPAMLTPGEFVIRKKAVETIGTGNLHKMNKYAEGGAVFKKQIPGGLTGMKKTSPIAYQDISKLKINDSGKGAIRGYFFENFVNKEFAVDAPENKFPDIPNLNAKKGLKEKLGLTKAQTGRDFKAAELKYRSGLNADFNSQYTPDNTAVLYAINKNSGGLIQKFKNGGMGKKLGARRFKDLDETELAQLSTDELIAYANKQAFNIFSTGGSGMATGSEFIEVPQERIIPELDSDLVTYMGKRGFWREIVSPFGKPKKQSAKSVSKIGRETALAAQVAKQSDEVAAREQQWTSITDGSSIDKYLLSTLQDPVLSDYKTARGGETLAKTFHNTRLRQAVNKALEEYDDFDYSGKNLDKLISNFAAKQMATGGIAQRFIEGGVATTGKLDESILQRIKALGGPGYIKSAVPAQLADAVKASGVGTTGRLLDSRSLSADPNSARLAPFLEKVLSAAEDIKKGKESAARQQLENNMKAAAGGAYQFGLVSLFGPNGELGYDSVSNAKELTGKNGEKFLTQIVRKSLPSKYADVIKQTQADIAGIPSRAAERFQYTDIFGTGGPLAFDFDETLVKGADIYAANGGVDIREYNDLAKVQEALGNAELTLLGKELAKRLIDYPELIDSIRVLTARPQSNAPFLASKLAELRLPIPENKITGVSGGLNKVNNLSEMETLIDDNLANIQSVAGGGKKGILYNEPSGIDFSDASSRKSMAVMEGYALEEMVKSLGVRISKDDDDPNRPIDYPKGLGASASKWGIKSTMPTDTKRTNDSSALGRLWGEAQRYFVEKFAFGGEVGESEFEKVKKEILNKYPDVNFRISKSKRKRGYNLLGGLKQEGSNIGNYADFKQPNNLSQLQEMADKMASSLMYEYGPNIDPSLLKKKSKFISGGPVKDVWHGTTTGKNDSALEAFKTQGAKSNISTGFGQGSGFYVYGGHEKAMVRALSLEGGSNEFLNAADPNGKPLALKFTEQLDSKNWDLDYEFQNADIVNFIYKNYERVKEALEKSKNQNIQNKLKEFSLDAKYDEYGDGDGSRVRKVGVSFTENNKKVERTLANFSGDIRSAEVLAGLTSSLLASDPDFYNEFEQDFFNKLTPDQAIKYVGSEPIKPVLAEIFERKKSFNDTKWNTVKFAEGGSAQDTVPALLTPGEFVINKKAAQKIGYSKLEKLNKADKIQGYNKGGSVGNIQRFVKGGVAEGQAARSYGSEIKDIKEAEKIFAMSLGSLSSAVKQEILKNFKGIEQVAGGGRTSFGNQFKKNTSGMAARRISRTASGDTTESLMALQLGGKYGAKSSVVPHETGHLVDASLGGGKDLSSSKKGSFQFELAEKAKPIMEKVYRESGLYSEKMMKYLTSNAELFAEFYSHASPDVKAIIASTTDAKIGMEKLAQHLGDVGYTFAGLEASDIIGGAGGGRRGGGPGSGGGTGGGGPPGGGGTPGNAKNKADTARVEQLEFFAYKAKEAGYSVEKYQRVLAKETAKLAKDLQVNLKNRLLDLKFTSTNVGAGLQGRSRKGPDDDKNFIRKAEETLLQKLKAIKPDLPLKDLETQASELVDRLIETNGSFDEAVQKVGGLSDVMDTTYSRTKALSTALKQLSEETGIAVEILATQGVRRDAAQRMDPAGNMAATFRDAIDDFGGPIRVAGIAATILADRARALIVSLDSNTQQNVGLMTAMGGFIGAMQGMVAGQVLGQQAGGVLEKLFPNIEGLGRRLEIAGTVVGMFIGAVNGAADAFYRANLDKILANVSKSAVAVDAAFENLARNNTPEAFNKAQKALADSSQNIVDLADSANFGAGGSSRTALEWMRGLDPTGMTSAISGAATEKEARDQLVGTIGGQVGRAQQLGEIRINQVDPQQIRESVDRIQEFDKQIAELKKGGGAGADAAIKDIESAKNEFLSSRSQVFGQLRQIYKTDKDAFLALYIEQAQRAGLTAQQISDAVKTPEGLEEAIQKGKELSAMYAEQEQRSRLLSDAVRSLNIQTENIINLYRLLEAGLTRFSQSIEAIVDDANSFTSAIKGQASIRMPQRVDQQILENASAFSTEEVRGAASRAGQLVGGGKFGEDLTNRVNSAKFLQDALPNILQNTTGQSADDIMAELSAQFAKAGLTLDPAIFDELSKTLEAKLVGKDEGAQVSELASDPEILGSLTKIAETSAKSAANIVKTFYDAMGSAVNLTNDYSKALQEATEWQLKAADIRIRSELQLSEALGKSSTLDQMNTPFDTRIQGLSNSSVLPGGSTDPAKLQNSLKDLITNRSGAEKELAKRMAAVGSAQDPAAKAEATKAVNDQLKLMAEQNVQINNTRTALEELANDSSAASNALQKLSDYRATTKAGVNLTQEILTSDSDKLRDINKQLSAYNKVITGQASGKDMANVQFRQQAFGGLDMLRSVMPEQIAQQMQAKMSRQMLTSMGVDLGQTIAIGPDNQKISLDQALTNVETGKDPQQEAYIEAYRQATERQARAADALAASAILMGEKILEGSQRIFDAFSKRIPDGTPDGTPGLAQQGEVATAAAAPPPKPPEEPGAPANQPLVPIDGFNKGIASLIEGFAAQSQESTWQVAASVIAAAVAAAVGVASNSIVDAITTNLTNRVMDRFLGGRGAGVAGDAAAGGGGGLGGALGVSQITAPFSGGPGVFGANVGGGAAGAALGTATAAGAAYGAYTLIDWVSSVGELITNFDGKMAEISARASEQQGKGYIEQVIQNLQEPGDALIQTFSEIGTLGSYAAQEIGKQIGLVQNDLAEAEKRLKNVNAARFGQDATNFNTLSPIAQSRAKFEAQSRLDLKRAQEIQASGGSLEDLKATMDPEAAAANRDKDLQTFINRTQKNVNEYDNQGSTQTYNKAVQEIMSKMEAEAVIQTQAAQTTAQAAQQQMTPGSIYVHDIHVESLIQKLIEIMSAYANNENKTYSQSSQLTPQAQTDMVVGPITAPAVTASTTAQTDAVTKPIIATENIKPVEPVLSRTPEQQKAIDDKEKADKEFADKYTKENPEYAGAYDEIAGGKSSLEARSAKGESLSELQQYELEEGRREEYFRRRNNGERDLDYDQMVHARQQRALKYENDTTTNTQYTSQSPISQGGMLSTVSPDASSVGQLITKPAVTASTTGGTRTPTITSAPASVDTVKNKQEQQKRLEELKKKGVYRTSLRGLPLGRNYQEQGEYMTLQKDNATPYQQGQKAKRQAYLSRFRPEVRETMLTDEEKAARKYNRTPNNTGSAPIPTPTPITAPTPAPTSTAQQTTSTQNEAMSSQSYSLTVDEKATQFLSSLTETIGGFGNYIKQLENVATTIPRTIDLVLVAEPIEVNVKLTGAAVMEELKKSPDVIKEMVDTTISNSINKEINSIKRWIKTVSGTDLSPGQ